MSREEDLAATERAIARATARREGRMNQMAVAADVAQQVATAVVTSGHCSLLVTDHTNNVVTVSDSAGRGFTVTVQPLSIADEPDDDGDDDESPIDPAIFDGGFGPESYFQRAMRKDD